MVENSSDIGWICPECGMQRDATRYDPCLGELPGVKFACCGHGGHRHNCIGGYIYFTNGKLIRFDKLTAIEEW
jgi:hypothetical protein